MVTKIYRCDICEGIYDERSRAAKCEEQGEPPELELPAYFYSGEDKDRNCEEYFIVSLSRRGLTKEGHHPIYIARKVDNGVGRLYGPGDFGRGRAPSKILISHSGNEILAEHNGTLDLNSMSKGRLESLMFPEDERPVRLSINEMRGHLERNYSDGDSSLIEACSYPPLPHELRNLAEEVKTA